MTRRSGTLAWVSRSSDYIRHSLNKSGLLLSTDVLRNVWNWLTRLVHQPVTTEAWVARAKLPRCLCNGLYSGYHLPILQ